MLYDGSIRVIGVNAEYRREERSCVTDACRNRSTILARYTLGKPNKLLLNLLMPRIWERKTINHQLHLFPSGQDLDTLGRVGSHGEQENHRDFRFLQGKGMEKG